MEEGCMTGSGMNGHCEQSKIAVKIPLEALWGRGSIRD